MSVHALFCLNLFLPEMQLANLVSHHKHDQCEHVSGVQNTRPGGVRS